MIRVPVHRPRSRVFPARRRSVLSTVQHNIRARVSWSSILLILLGLGLGLILRLFTVAPVVPVLSQLLLSLTTRPGNRNSRAWAQFVRCHIRPVQDFAKRIAGGVVQIGMEILVLHLARCDNAKILNALYLHRACDKKAKTGPWRRLLLLSKVVYIHEIARHPLSVHVIHLTGFFYDHIDDSALHTAVLMRCLRQHSDLAATRDKRDKQHQEYFLHVQSPSYRR